MDYQSLDKALIWHPFTQSQLAASPIPIKSGQGAYLFDHDNSRYLDLISSWWVNLHGHAQKDIAKAIYQQSLNLEHVIFAGFTHQPAIELAQSLRALLPEPLTKFFFSDNGSTAIEVALKMAHQYWFNKGEKQRKLFLCLEGSYHGDTFGAMSVARSSAYHKPFHDLMFEVVSVPIPTTWLEDEELIEKEAKCLEHFQFVLDDLGDHFSAMVLEPLVQGAGGMRMIRAEFIDKLVRLAQEKGILIIFDEVMTGFGRTGTTFALEQLSATPDFLCVSKGITGGFLPLSLTITSDKIHQEFLSNDWDKTFFHGHSYTANPIACAAAIASLKLLLKPETQRAISTIEQVHRVRLPELASNFPQLIEKIRIQGTICAFDLSAATSEQLQALKAHFLNEGLLIRPLGNVVYLLPPYCITKDELELAYKQIASCLARM